MARIHELLVDHRTVSFEVFPPRTAKGAAALTRTLNDLDAVPPSFISVTYGAAGSDRRRTADAVFAIQQERGVPTMPHLTCVGHRREEIAALCDRYAAAGVENMLALGGDLPADGSLPADSDFRFASDLVEFLRADGRFSIGVAAHPEGHPRSNSLPEDRRVLAQKLSMADFAITQFFFEVEDYFRLVDDLRAIGCDKPVIPGVIPITNAAQVDRFAALAGATIPSRLTTRLASADPADVERIGVDVARRLSQRLLDGGAPGVHLYTLNRGGPSLAVASGLSVASF
jgi:methylenetetrahydrofolate reductase (NADPH)